MYQYISLLEISNTFRSRTPILVVTGNKDPGRVATWPGHKLATEMLVTLCEISNSQSSTSVEYS